MCAETREAAGPDTERRWGREENKKRAGEWKGTGVDGSPWSPWKAEEEEGKGRVDS